MKKNRFTLFILIGFLLFSSCTKENNSEQIFSDDERYINAIKDAMIAEQDEICTKLIGITESNSFLTWRGTGTDKRVLVVTWTKYPGSFLEDTVKNSWGEVWVTVAPELKNWFKNNYSDTSFVYRAEELLGLPKNRGYTHFAELWVKPQDLFRPSPDNDITDNSALTNFPADADSAYRAWFNGNIIYSYYPMRYPWTRLGYTYDWGNPESEIGLSEFVIKKNSGLIVHTILDNETFFKNIYQNK